MAGADVALTLYLANRSRLVGYARTILDDPARAEDIVQEAWLHLKRAVSRGPLHDPAPYLQRIVRNLAVDARRRARLEARHIITNADDIATTIADDAPSADSILHARSALDRLKDALGNLPERQRIAIEMYRLGDFKLREIAEKLGISISLTHSLIVQGLATCHQLCRQDLEAGD